MRRFADLLLGRLAFDQPDGSDHNPDDNGKNDQNADRSADPAEQKQWLEVEIIDPDTGELLGTQLQRIDSDGEPVDPTPQDTRGPASQPRLMKQPRQQRIGIVVPLASLLGASQAPGELADRYGFIPGEALKELIAETLDPDSRTEVLFTRLLTDNTGRLLDTTELGRSPSARLAEPIKIRAGTCRIPPAPYSRPMRP